MSRILSLVVATAYVIMPLIGAVKGDSEAVKGLIIMVGYLVLPLACIWFGDEMGSWTGTMKLRQITDTSSGGWVVVLGWVLLLMPLIAMGVMILREVLTQRIEFRRYKVQRR